MSFFLNIISGAPTLVWGLSVLLQVTLVTTVALMVAHYVRRIPVLRYGVLCSSLFLVLLTPCMTLVMQRSGIRLLSMSVTQDSAGSAANLTESRHPGVAKFPSSSREYSGGKSDHVPGFADSTGDVFALGRPKADPEVSSHEDSASGGADSGDTVDSAGALHAEGASSSTGIAVPLGILPRIGDWPLTVMRPVMIIWFTGTLFLLARLIVNGWRLAVMLRSCKPMASGSFAPFVNTVIRDSGIRKVPEILLSDRVSSPVSAGLLRPRIILPEGLVDRVSPEQLRDILLHELAHIERRDQGIVWLQNIADAFYWLHPLVGRLNRKLAQSREEVCDNFVLDATDGPSYSRTLLALTELIQTARPLPGAAGLFMAHWKLEDRIAGLLDENRDRRTFLTMRGKAFVCLLSLVIAGIAAIGTLTPANGQGERADDDAQVANDVEADKVTELSGSSSLETQSADTPTDEGIAATPTIKPIRMSGHIVAANGQPAPHAIVEIRRVSSPSFSTEITADSQGKFETWVQVKREGLASTRVSASSVDGSELGYYRFPWDRENTASESVNIKLTRTTSPRITVVDVDGNPVPNANVAIQLEYPHVVSGATTDDSGSATLRIPESERIEGVVAWKDQLGLDYRSYTLSRERRVDALAKVPEFPASGEETLELDGASPLTVRVVDDRNQPLAGTRVYPLMLSKISEPNFINLSYFTPMLSQRTDVSGETTFHWVPSWHESEITLWSDAEGHVRLRGHYDPQSDAEPVELKLDRLVPIRGQVLDAAGTPLEGIAVTARGAGYTLDEGRAVAMTDKEGRYELLVPPDQIYLVVVTDEQWAAPPQTGFAVFRNQPVENKDFILRQATRVHGTLVDELTGKPIPGEIVNVFQYGQELDLMTGIELPNPENSKRYVQPMHVLHATTDEQGRFEFSLGDGQFDIRPPRPDEGEPFEIAGEAERELQVTTKFYQQVRLIEGVITNSDGIPLDGARITGVPRRRSDGHDWQAVTAADGSFRVNRYRDPTILHAISANRQWGGITEIEATRDSIELQLQRVGSAAGRLLMPDSDRPFSDQRIAYGVRVPNRGIEASSFQFGGEVITDRDGKFQLEELVPDWEYIMYLPDDRGGVTQLLLRVIISPGETFDLGNIPAPLLR